MRRGLCASGRVELWSYPSSKPIPLLLQSLGRGIYPLPNPSPLAAFVPLLAPRTAATLFWRSYSAQDASKSGQDAFKSAMIASKIPLRGFKCSQVVSKGSKMPSRPPLRPDKSKKNIQKTMEIVENTRTFNKSVKRCQELPGRV